MKFCILLCFSVLQIKLDCRQFASILELCLFSNLEYCKYSFLHFSLTRFDILSWNFAHDFVLLYYRSTSSVVNGYQFHFDICFNLTYIKLWHIELKFCTWLCFTVLQVNFKCRQWVSISLGVMSLLGLRILEIHSFLHFSPAFFDILSWNFSYNFV